MSKSPSLRRIQADIRELSLDPSPSFHAAPLENDMFEWHFTIRGAKGTDFEGGVYHGRILLPPEYPFKPPHIIFLTPSGRFGTNTKVCLSFSAYHPELWQPAWGIRLILEALISFLPTPADGAIGALDWKPKERQRLALQSQKWCCPLCGPIVKLLPEVSEEDEKKKSTTFSKQIAELHRLQQQAEEQRRQSSESLDGNEESANKETTDVGSNSPPAPTANIDASSPEEEIVFDTNDDSESEGKWEDIDDDIKEAKEDEEKEDNVATNQEQNFPVTTDEVPQEAEELNTSTQDNVPNMPQQSTFSWADPLVNLLIVLLIAICYLLYQKYLQLDLELQELEAYQYSQSLATATEGSVMKSATVGDEL